MTDQPQEIRPIKDLRFVVVGAYVMDCFITTSHLPEWGKTFEARSIRTTPGGKALNQAVALARLGAQVTAVGVVGDDAVGHDVLVTLKREGVDVSGMEIRAGVATTVCACFVGDAGESAIVWHIDENIAVTSGSVRAAKAAFEGADAALMTFEMPVTTVREAIEVAHIHKARVFVQPAPQLADPTDANLIPWDQIDILVPNEEEARALLDDDGDALASELAHLLSSEFAVPGVVVTLGKEGCVAYLAGTTVAYPAEQVEALDATGAGDAFSAALVANLVAGEPGIEAIRAAQVNAMRAIRCRGGHESMPSQGWKSRGEA